MGYSLPARLVEFIQGKIQQGYQVRILLEHLNAKSYQGMLGYLSKQLPEVELKVTGFDYQGSLDERMWRVTI